MNITAILLKKVILEADSEIWSRIRKHYLPSEYQSVYAFINKHFESYGKIPSFDALKLSIRSDALLNKVYAIQLAEDVELETAEILEYLKNQYTQEEIMDRLNNYLDESIMMETAKENLESLHNIILHIEDRVDLKNPEEDMSKMGLFDSEEEIANQFVLGLNSDFDSKIKFSNKDYILIGGIRGSGKSLTCSNIAANNYRQGKSSIYFTIEMSSRAILQRVCAIDTGISATRLRNRSLSTTEWVTIAKWWSARFVGGEEALSSYRDHRDFDKLHNELTSRHSLREDCQLDIVYDPSMSLANVRSELDKKVEKIKPAVILVDYVNQLKRSNNSNMGQYDWTEQIELSKALKCMAQEYEIPIVSPYQMDATGEARFAKGLLDSADAAFTLNAHDKSDNCMTFDCVKMRDNEEISFTSSVDWNSLKIGPDSVVDPNTKADKEEEDADDL